MTEDLTNKNSDKMVRRDEHGRVISGVLNPKGRPKKGQSMTELMKVYLEDMEPGEEVTRKEKFIKKVFEMAFKDGDFGTMKLIWNYIDGMPVQKILTKDIDELKEIPIDEIYNELHRRRAGNGSSEKTGD